MSCVSAGAVFIPLPFSRIATERFRSAKAKIPRLCREWRSFAVLAQLRAVAGDEAATVFGISLNESLGTRSMRFAKHDSTAARLDV